MKDKRLMRKMKALLAVAFIVAGQFPASAAGITRDSAKIVQHYQTDELLSTFCIITHNTLSRLKSSDDVRDDEDAKETLVKVPSHPILPMWYRKNVNLHTFTVL